MTQDIALTISINPKTFVTARGNRRRWENHSHEIQTEFLDYVLKRMDTDDVRYLYGFEKTKADNVHLHVHVKVDNVLDSAKVKLIRDEFISKLPKMTQEYKLRLWDQQLVYDCPGWERYVLKEQQKAITAACEDDVGSIADCLSDLDSPHVRPTKKLF